MMVETFPISLLLGSMALALAVVGGVTLGILAAVYQNRSWDYVSVSVATLGVSVPNFVLAVFLIVLFSFVLPIFPTGGWNSPKDWVLPTVTLALAPPRRSCPRARRRPPRAARGPEPLPRRVASPAAQPARGGGGRGGHPPLPCRDLRGPDRPAVLHQGQPRPPLRVAEPRIPARHRPARARRALASDLRRARLHAGGPRGAGDHRADRGAHRGALRLHRRAARSPAHPARRPHVPLPPPPLLPPAVAPPSAPPH